MFSLLAPCYLLKERQAFRAPFAPPCFLSPEVAEEEQRATQAQEQRVHHPESAHDRFKEQFHLGFKRFGAWTDAPRELRIDAPLGGKLILSLHAVEELLMP